MQTEILIRLCLEESDLSFVTFFVGKESVSSDPFSSQTFNLCHFDNCVVIGRPLVVTEVIVPTGNEQMKDLKVNAKRTWRIVRADLPVKISPKRSPFAAVGEGA
ncbi:MAG TPA: hypothetical protein VK692_07220 [Chthoniobacterales bacterium]|nr:hypothetical protein [Chthoniobacterales bacterium]